MVEVAGDKSDLIAAEGCLLSGYDFAGIAGEGPVVGACGGP